MNQIERSFADVRGEPCWGVRRGYGSFVTFEFGPPHLVVREPQLASPGASRRVQKLLSRRSVNVHGRWHLWIYCCDWFVLENGRPVGDCTTRRRIDRAAGELNGRKLLEVTLYPRGARTRFVFESGAELETKPYDRSSEQWFLYEPGGKVLAWRADRRYQYGYGDRPPNRVQWRPLSR